MLDQIRPWNIDPELLVDFLFLPDSYFYADAPEKFGKLKSIYNFCPMTILKHLKHFNQF